MIMGELERNGKEEVMAFKMYRSIYVKKWGKQHNVLINIKDFNFIQQTT
jgi:hypothetical protein